MRSCKPPMAITETAVPISPTHEPILLRVATAAALLGMSEKALRHRIERGQIPGVTRIGHSLFLRRSDLLRLIAEGRGLSPSGSR